MADWLIGFEEKPYGRSAKTVINGALEAMTNETYHQVYRCRDPRQALLLIKLLESANAG